MCIGELLMYHNMQVLEEVVFNCMGNPIVAHLISQKQQWFDSLLAESI